MFVSVPGASNIEELRDCLKYINAPEDQKTFETGLEEVLLNEISE